MKSCRFSHAFCWSNAWCAWLRSNSPIGDVVPVGSGVGIVQTQHRRDHHQQERNAGCLGPKQPRAEAMKDPSYGCLYLHLEPPHDRRMAVATPAEPMRKRREEARSASAKCAYHCTYMGMTTCTYRSESAGRNTPGLEELVTSIATLPRPSTFTMSWR